MNDISTHAYVVEVSASVMPPLTEAEVQEAVLKAAVVKERQHGMGHLSVVAYEAFNEQTRQSQAGV